MTKLSGDKVFTIPVRIVLDLDSYVLNYGDDEKVRDVRYYLEETVQETVQDILNRRGVSARVAIKAVR